MQSTDIKHQAQGTFIFPLKICPTSPTRSSKDLKKANILHIDVRERWEIDRFGKIPVYINIPLGELVEALQMDPADFKEQYNQNMAAKSGPVVFSCLVGTRSKPALSFAMSLGFSRIQQYAGGFEDWVKHEPPEKKMKMTTPVLAPLRLEHGL